MRFESVDRFRKNPFSSSNFIWLTEGVTTPVTAASPSSETTDLYADVHAAGSQGYLHVGQELGQLPGDLVHLHPELTGRHQNQHPGHRNLSHRVSRYVTGAHYGQVSQFIRGHFRKHRNPQQGVHPSLIGTDEHANTYKLRWRDIHRNKKETHHTAI